MLKYFRTDGIRGRIGVPPLTPEFILKLGWAVGSILSTTSASNKILIGKDTRISGYLFESALQAGLSAAGTDVLMVGPMPTPAIAYLTHTLHAHIGIVISASHNTNADNGIKFFSSLGFKLSEEMEEEIEKQLEKPLEIKDANTLGKVYRIHDAPGRYIEFCKSAIAHYSNFEKLKIVVDCANGATYHIAPRVFSELGATVLPINTTPNGLNINDNCGSLHPAALQKSVVETNADLGIAFDGDGDRVILVDNKGEIIDGDEILFMIAKHLVENNHFSGGVVGTDMSNKGLEIALQRLGISFVRTDVGDQHVMAELQKRNWFLGGENSGHIINLRVNTTADGIIGALQIMEALISSGKTLHELKKGMPKLPQRMTNIPYHGSQISLDHPTLSQEIKNAEAKLQPHGRILLRYSGTESMIRLMIEDEDLNQVNDLSTHLCNLINQLIKEKNG